jgi:hypothetical protein
MRRSEELPRFNVMALSLVCKSWSKLFQGVEGYHRRPKAWLKQAFNIDAITESEATKSLKKRLQIVRSFNAANAPRAIQISSLARAAGLDLFQSDAWKNAQDAWWVGMRQTISKLATIPWSVNHIQLSLRGINFFRPEASPTNASFGKEIDELAASLFPVAAARGSLRNSSGAFSDYQIQLRTFLGELATRESQPSSLSHELQFSKDSRPSFPALLSSGSGAADDSFELAFDGFEVDADNYEEVSSRMAGVP